MKNTFVIRIITSAVFVVVLIGGALLSPIALLLIFALVIIKGLMEYYRMVLYAGHKPQIFTGIALGLLILFTNYFIASEHINDSLSASYVLIVIFLTIAELYRDTEAPFTNIAHTLFGVLYIAVPFSLISYMIYSDIYHSEYNPNILIAMFMLIWASDAGAYIVGSLIGKHKLFPQISPKKTWEGFLGGALLSILASYGIAQYITEIHWLHWIAIAVIVVVFGTFGDLTESLLKRKINIKDSGRILPGHGGVLDRFDSTLMAAPIVLMYITFFC